MPQIFTLWDVAKLALLAALVIAGFAVALAGAWRALRRARALTGRRTGDKQG